MPTTAVPSWVLDSTEVTETCFGTLSRSTLNSTTSRGRWVRIWRPTDSFETVATPSTDWIRSPGSSRLWAGPPTVTEATAGILVTGCPAARSAETTASLCEESIIWVSARSTSSADWPGG